MLKTKHKKYWDYHNQISLILNLLQHKLLLSVCPYVFSQNRLFCIHVKNFISFEPFSNFFWKIPYPFALLKKRPECDGILLIFEVSLTSVTTSFLIFTKLPPFSVLWYSPMLSSFSNPIRFEFWIQTFSISFLIVSSNWDFKIFINDSKVFFPFSFFVFLEKFSFINLLESGCFKCCSYKILSKISKTVPPIVTKSCISTDVELSLIIPFLNWFTSCFSIFSVAGTCWTVLIFGW